MKKKKLARVLAVMTLTMSVLAGCNTETKPDVVDASEVFVETSTEAVTEDATIEETIEETAEVKKEITAVSTPDEVKEFLIKNNAQYVETGKNIGDISAEKRQDLTDNGQHPYATIITCSDSRVPVEHVFNAGLGEIFTIRSAGNVIGDFELGSVEYGAEHLGTPLVVVLGHTNCGAVAATLEGGATGAIKNITDEIESCLPEEEVTSTEAEILNVNNSIARIMESEEMQHLVEEGHVKVVGAIYDITSGEVTFLE